MLEHENPPFVFVLYGFENLVLSELKTPAHTRNMIAGIHLHRYYELIYTRNFKKSIFYFALPTFQQIPRIDYDYVIARLN